MHRYKEWGGPPHEDVLELLELEHFLDEALLFGLSSATVPRGFKKTFRRRKIDMVSSESLELPGLDDSEFQISSPLENQCWHPAL